MVGVLAYFPRGELVLDVIRTEFYTGQWRKEEGGGVDTEGNSCCSRSATRAELSSQLSHPTPVLRHAWWW